MPKIFVYGALLKGMERSSALNTSRYLGLGVIHADLYDLGRYPGIKDGDGLVVGEVYEVNQIMLDRLDALEGYDPRYHRESLFIRRKIETRWLYDGNSIDCYTYFYNQSVRSRYLISHGDTRRYLMEEASDKQWLVAYGSNLSSVLMNERVGKIEECKKGYLNGYDLVFNKKAYQHHSVRANIRYDAKSRCPAVAWRLSREQLKVLDRFEGVPHQYLRVTLSIMTDEGPLLAQGYIAHPDVLVSGLDIQDEYLEHIKNGYEEHGFDVDNLTK